MGSDYCPHRLLAIAFSKVSFCYILFLVTLKIAAIAKNTASLEEIRNAYQ
jgi:hypothetical protein